MAKVGRCNGCGMYFSETWKTRENCRKCGGSIDHLDEDIGPVEHLPRSINAVGLILLVIALLILIAGNTKNGATGSLGPLILIILSAVLFLFSLISLNIISGMAIERRQGSTITRRRMASSNGKKIRKGRSGTERKLGRKIIK